jgi:hypothetical protein
MTRSLKSVALGVFAVWVLSSLGAVSARAAPVFRQEKHEEKHIKGVRIAKSPCVFISASRKRGMLGVRLTHLTRDLRTHFGAPEDAGVMISSVTPASPAEKAGLKVGDIITAIDGREVSSPGDVSRRIRSKREGDVAQLQIVREKSPSTLSATIEERERSEVDLGNFFLEDCDELDFDLNFEFDEEAVREAIETATRHFQSPEWKSQWKWIERFSEEQLEEKLREFEKKLEKLEEELEQLEEKKRQKLEQ